MIKKIVLVLGIVGVMAFGGVVMAMEVPAVKNDTYVYDGAGVIDDNVEVGLNNKLRNLEKDTSAELFVVTVDGLDGGAIEDLSHRTANEMGIGQAEHDNGLLLFVSPPEGTRNVRIEVGRGMEGIFNDAKVGRILDADFVPFRENGDYQSAIAATVDSLVTETRDNAEWVGKASAPDEDAWIILVVFGFVLVVFVIVVANVRRAHKLGIDSLKKKGKSDIKYWAAVAAGMAIINKNNENFRNRHSSDGWHGGVGGGGWSGGGSGGGSFGGGGATR